MVSRRTNRDLAQRGVGGGLPFASYGKSFKKGGCVRTEEKVTGHGTKCVPSQSSFEQEGEGPCRIRPNPGVRSPQKAQEGEHFSPKPRGKERRAELLGRAWTWKDR